MAYPNGFTYVSGPARYVWSAVSSTATFRAFNPVTLGLGRVVSEANSLSTQIYGIAMNNAADSLPGIGAGRTLVLIPEPETVFATKIQTGVATSATSAGETWGIEKSGNHFRIDTDSRVTPFLVIVGDQFGTTVNSDDSSVFVRFLGSVLGMYSSSNSTTF